MGASLTDYYSEIQKGIDGLEQYYAQIDFKRKQSLDQDFDMVDWSGVLWTIQRAINKLHLMASVHQFERVAKEQLQALFMAFSQGQGTGKVVIPIDYTIKENDTPRSLEAQYGIPASDILAYNSMSSSDFAAGVVIQLPYPVSMTQRVSNDILVFGDQSGEKILGSDLPNSFSVGGSGDLTVLAPRDAFTQHINNMVMTQRGGIPFYESYGTDLTIGEDYETESIESMIQMKIADSVAQDPRVKDLNVLSVERDATNKTQVNAAVEIQPTQGLPIIITATT